MSASPSIHYQDVDSSVLLPLVSWWSPLPSTSTNNSRRGFHGCGPATWNALLFSVRTDNRSSDASGRALKRHLYSIWCRLLLLALQRLLMWRIINAMIIIIRHSLVRAKGEVFVLLYVFVRFLSTISRQPAGWFTPNVACGHTLVPGVSSPLLGVSGPGGNEIFVKNLCRMRMASLCQLYWRTCYYYYLYTIGRVHAPLDKSVLWPKKWISQNCTRRVVYINTSHFR